MAEVDHVHRLELESNVMDLEGDAALLSIIYDQHIDDGSTAWDLLGLKPKPGYRLYMLTDSESQALSRAVELIHSDVRTLSRLFYGTPEAA